MDSSNRRRLFSLISKLQDQQLTAGEKAELQQILTTDAEARKLYYELMEMEQSLQEDSFSQSAADKTFVDKDSKNPIAFFFKVAAAIVVMASLSTVGFYLLKNFDHTPIQGNFASETREPVGVISKLEGRLARSDGASIAAKSDLFEGKYTILSGSARFDFFAGVSVELEAPGTFSVVSPVHINVEKGNLAVKVHDARSMFKVTSSKSAYVDLGTEFSIQVEDDGSSELHVFEGSVLASSLSKQGNSERIQLVNTDQTLRISGQEGPIGAMQHELQQEQLPRIRQPDRTRLEVGPVYSGSVKQSRPDGYWSFSRDPLEAVPLPVDHNEAPLELKSIGSSLESVSDGQNCYLQFNQTDKFQALTISKPIHFSHNQRFSVEFWIRPDQINRATVFAVYDPQSVKPSGETNHLALIDLMHWPISFHHVPAAIRAAIRTVPSDDYYSGINMFSNRHYIPGEWMHIALVKSENYAAIYLNGTESNRVQFTDAEETQEGDYEIVFGQMAVQDWDTTLESQKRPFVGAMDEIAFFLRDLSPEEIKTHYNSRN